MKNVLLNLSFITAILFISSCSGTRTVERVDPKETIDLSGRWNDTDSRLVAEEMVKDVLARPWRTEFTTRKSTQPRIIVGTIKNKSHEHIASETFITDIERELLNSGLIKLAAGKEAREEIREERGDQQEFASAETAKAWGKEKGADYMLQGSINSIVDEYGNKKTVTYQVSLVLTDLETNEKVWIGDKKIKKYIEN
ncbi:MAG: penicillin-binding protein activator LpoB [Chitinophagales bacterium]|nr:penicillin-binding protein activator LpoB [Chitinophagales bacterium]